MPTPLPWRTNQQLAEAVRAAREAAGMTQAALAERARVGLKFLYELESGKDTLRTDKVLDVLKVLGLHLLVAREPQAAYEIAGQREGIYVLEVINGPGELTAELDRRLRVFDTVVRHMVVRVDEELAVAARAGARRKDATVKRRVRRGLPPEPTESERKRRTEDEDGDGGDQPFRGGER